MDRPDLRKPLLVDRFGRGIDYVRLSVTSRCNLRCVYCMREEHSNESVSFDELQYDDICRILDVLKVSGIRKIRLTGGEPLLRGDILNIVRYAKTEKRFERVVLTTNGVLLERHIQRLLEEGIDGINISLDTFDVERYREITRRSSLKEVLRSLQCLFDDAVQLDLKINVVMLKGINGFELPDFVELTRNWPVTVRFMELMPFDDHQIWRTGRFMGAGMVYDMLREHYPELESLRGKATEHFSFSLPEYAGTIAIIPAFTRNFCSQCNRLRITSSGKIISCLYSGQHVDLLDALHNGSCNGELVDLLGRAVAAKPRDGRNASDGNHRTSMAEIGG